MNKIDINKSLAEFVSDDIRAASIFEKYNLDFCCHGKLSLDESCKKKGLDNQKVVDELESLTASTSNFMEDYNSWELDKLIEDIIKIHHTYVTENMPVISAHANKVAAVHGGNHPELIEIPKIFSLVNDELSGHLFKEENILFPFIVELAEAKRNNKKINQPRFGTVANPIKMMEYEHESAGSALAQLRTITNNYSLPLDACTTYTLLFKELDAFEKDLHIHIHKESNILFPKAIQFEKELLT